MDVRQVVLEELAGARGLPVSALADIDPMGVGSLELYEAVSCVEDRLGVELHFDDLVDISSLDELVAVFEAKVAET